MATPTPSSKANIDPNYEDRLNDIKSAAQEEFTQRTTGGQATWFRPESWEGDLFDVEGYSEPFQRDAATEDYMKAVSDAQAPGTTGDVVATTTMIDYLGVMERAFRARHTMTRCRAMAHMLARKRGHGHDRGPIVQAGLEYVRGILAQSKS